MLRNLLCNIFITEISLIVVQSLSQRVYLQGLVLCRHHFRSQTPYLQQETQVLLRGHQQQHLQVLQVLNIITQKTH